MLPNSAARVGYVVKRYPRFSETFIVNEILAHEAAGVSVDIFSLRPPTDTHFQDALARVRASVTYVPERSIHADEFWSAFSAAETTVPNLWSHLSDLGPATGLDVYQALIVARLARERDIRHLHAHFASSATSVARLAARIADLPYSFTAHAKDIFHESVSDADLSRKLTDAAAVVTVSDYNLAYLSERYGAAAARVQRVYNGLDLLRFPYASPLVRSPRILAVGRLVEKKGFDVLLDACSLLRRRGVPFHAEIVGGGELEAELRAQMHAQDLVEHVELSGPRPQAAVIDQMQNAAVFAVPSVDGADGNREGLPTVLLEAMALGTPVVATDVTGIPEVVHNELTGLLVPQRDPVALADALQRLLADDALRVDLAERARRLIVRDFDIERNAARMRAAIGIPVTCADSHSVESNALLTVGGD